MESNKSSLLPWSLNIWFGNVYICQTRHISRLIPGGDMHFKYKEKFGWYCHNPKTRYNPFRLKPGRNYLKYIWSLLWDKPFKFSFLFFSRFWNKISANIIVTIPNCASHRYFQSNKGLVIKGLLFYTRFLHHTTLHHTTSSSKLFQFHFPYLQS